MLLVVLGHTMTGCTQNSQQSFLFNIVWTLQMPLFMLISGYVNKYSKPILTAKALSGFVQKRTFAYLAPFAVWTFIIRGVVFRQTDYLNVGRLIYTMDNGYWFLFSVWTISMIWGIANYLGGRLAKTDKEFVRLVAVSFFYVCGMVVLVLIGCFAGLSFLCIKLTLYYMPFYYAGYLFGMLEGKVNENPRYKTIQETVSTVCFLLWIYLMNRYNFFESGDGGLAILIRAAASLSGCIAVCGLTASALNAQETAGYPANVVYKFFLFSGQHSLEIYLSHYLLLSMVKPSVLPDFASPLGVLLTAGNYGLTLFSVFVFVWLTQNSSVINILLFGKTK